MKIYLAFAALASSLFFNSCTNPDSQKENAAHNTDPASPSGAPTMPAETPQPVQAEPSNPATPPQPVVSASPSNTVFHYICPNKCAGGGSEGQGKCPVCKTDLVHNDAFHNQQQQPQVNMQQQNKAIQLNTANPAQQQPPQPAQEPAQNAKGVWHYICPKGCAGGGGQAVACSNCGTQMEHNQKYHE